MNNLPYFRQMVFANFGHNITLIIPKHTLCYIPHQISELQQKHCVTHDYLKLIITELYLIPFSSIPTYPRSIKMYKIWSNLI